MRSRRPTCIHDSCTRAARETFVTSSSTASRWSGTASTKPWTASVSLRKHARKLEGSCRGQPCDPSGGRSLRFLDLLQRNRRRVLRPREGATIRVACRNRDRQSSIQLFTLVADRNDHGLDLSDARPRLVELARRVGLETPGLRVGGLLDG